MATYNFKYRRIGQFFWRNLKVVGHSVSVDAQGNVVDRNRMTLYFEDGALQEIPDWLQCEVRLGADWFRIRHKEMEQKAGQSIPVNVVE